MVSEKLSEEDFEFIYSKVPRVCVDLIIKEKDKILFTKRSIEPFKRKWHLPGGGIRFGEKIEDAAKRIAKEELNIEIELEKMIGEIEYHDEKKYNRHSISFVFLAKKKSGKIKVNGDSEKAVFYENLPEEMIPEVKKFLGRRKLSK